MIKINRTGKPSVLQKKETIWVAKITNASSAYERHKAISKYRHPEIKARLSEMFNGKCAFCESYIENVDYGDIEHFKPKAKFPYEAVIWENLLLSCKKCNGAGQKGDECPLENEGGLLINPCEENPDGFFSFEFDEETLVSIVKPKNERGETSERIYGLNKQTLIKDRNQKVRIFVFLARYYNTDPTARNLLDEFINASGEYSAFAKVIKERYVNNASENN